MLLTAGVTAALANFVAWYVAAGLGVASGGAGIYGGMLWQRRGDQLVRENAWRAVTTTAPGSPQWPEDDDASLLTMLLPGRRAVPFSVLHDRLARRVVQWALADSPARASVLYVNGAPGVGKSRLLVEVAERLAIPCAWAVPGRGAAAVAAAAALQRRVMLVVDDADTCDDLQATLIAWAETAGSEVRLVVISRVNDPWWAAVRSRQPARVLAGLPYRPQLTVPAVVKDAKSQQQMFARALRCFVAESAPVPQVTLKPKDPPPSIALLHAAAALAARTDVGGTVDLANVAADLFVAERHRWQASVSQAELQNLPGVVLEQALLLAALVGAADEEAARRLLTHLRSPAGVVGNDRAGQLADWLRGLYPHQLPDWLSPRLPAVLLEHYAVHTVARSPALARLLVDATREDDIRTERMLSTLGRAAAHSPDAIAATSAVLDCDPLRTIAAAIRVASAGELPFDEAIESCIGRHADRFGLPQLRQLYESVPREAQTHRLARCCVALLRACVAHPAADPEDLDTHVIRQRLAVVIFEQGRFGAAEEEFREVLAARTRLLGAEHPDTLETNTRLAVLLDKTERSDAEKQFREVLAARVQELGTDHPDTLNTRASLALVLNRQGRYDAAEEEFRKVLATQTRLLGVVHHDTLTTRNNVAVVLREQGRLGEAETGFRDLLADRTRFFGAEHAETLVVRGNLAVVLEMQGRYDAAEEEFRELLAARTRLLGPEHPDTVNARNSLAVVLSRKGQHSEAEAELRQVLTMHTRSLGAEHSDTLTARSNLAVMLDEQGWHGEAETEFRELLALRTRSLGAGHRHTLSTRNSIAIVLVKQQRLGEAEAELRDLLATRTRLLGADHPDTLNTRSTLAAVLSEQERYAEAQAEFRHLLNEFTRLLGPEHPRTLAVLTWLRAQSRAPAAPSGPDGN
nr:tetratricopeptide repeat protein [Micromonospora tarapacensis]